MAEATKIAVASMLSTARADLSVGPPYDLAHHRNGTFVLDEGRLHPDTELLADLQARWMDYLMAGVDLLPDISPSDL